MDKSINTQWTKEITERFLKEVQRECVVAA